MNKEYAPQWAAPHPAHPLEPRAAAPQTHAAALKQIVTIRLDTDMLAWYKDAGPGYQTRINRILRQLMMAHMTARQGDGGGEPN